MAVEFPLALPIPPSSDPLAFFVYRVASGINRAYEALTFIASGRSRELSGTARLMDVVPRVQPALFLARKQLQLLDSPEALQAIPEPERTLAKKVVRRALGDVERIDSSIGYHPQTVFDPDHRWRGRTRPVGHIRRGRPYLTLEKSLAAFCDGTRTSRTSAEILYRMGQAMKVGCALFLLAECFEINRSL